MKTFDDPATKEDLINQIKKWMRDEGIETFSEFQKIARGIK